MRCRTCVPPERSLDLSRRRQIRSQCRRCRTSLLHQSATIAVLGPDQLGEGPVWDDRSGELVRVDISGRLVHRWNPATDAVDVVRHGGRCRRGRAVRGRRAGAGHRVRAVARRHRRRDGRCSPMSSRARVCGSTTVAPTRVAGCGRARCTAIASHGRRRSTASTQAAC